MDPLAKWADKKVEKVGMIEWVLTAVNTDNVLEIQHFVRQWYGWFVLVNSVSILSKEKGEIGFSGFPFILLIDRELNDDVHDQHSDHCIENRDTH